MLRRYKFVFIKATTNGSDKMLVSQANMLFLNIEDAYASPHYRYLNPAPCSPPCEKALGIGNRI